MVDVRVEQKPGFRVVGCQTWISGQDNEQFARFWAECHGNGVISRLHELRGSEPGPVTGSALLGISRVEADPKNRAFFFYAAAESAQTTGDAELESFTVPACTWAVFRNRGQMPTALIEAEMHAFMEWLPKSGYQHAPAPEMEAYLPSGGADEELVEFWLPISPAQIDTPSLSARRG